MSDELYQPWNKGGGWNRAGVGADSIKKWVKADLLNARVKIWGGE